MFVILARTFLILIALAFALWIVANQTPISLDFGPLGTLHNVPFSILIMATLAVGFLMGWLFYHARILRKAKRRGMPITLANKDQYRMTIQTKHEMIDWMAAYSPQNKKNTNGRTHGHC